MMWLITCHESIPHSTIGRSTIKLQWSRWKVWFLTNMFQFLLWLYLASYSQCIAIMCHPSSSQITLGFPRVTNWVWYTLCLAFLWTVALAPLGLVYSCDMGISRMVLTLVEILWKNQFLYWVVMLVFPLETCHWIVLTLDALPFFLFYFMIR